MKWCVEYDYVRVGSESKPMSIRFFDEYADVLLFIKDISDAVVIGMEALV